MKGGFPDGFIPQLIGKRLFTFPKTLNKQQKVNSKFHVTVKEKEIGLKNNWHYRFFIFGLEEGVNL